MCEIDIKRQRYIHTEIERESEREGEVEIENGKVQEQMIECRVIVLVGNDVRCI